MPSRSLLALSSLLVFAQGAFAAEPVAPAATLFDLGDVTLGPSPFLEAQQRDRAYMLSLEPDRLLHTFRLNYHLPSSAIPYGGWEGPTVELRGHTLGHYLTACALMYRSTGDAAFRQRIDAIVAALAQCQAAAPGAGYNPGYLSAFPESFFDRLEKRQDVWAPWYTLHKLLAGLIDAHQLAGNAPALDVAKNMAGWIRLRVDRLSREQMQATLQTEFGGIGEALANLHAITHDPDHLRVARAFDHDVILNPLARGVDALDGVHGNTQVPKIIAAAREYELTGEDRYRQIAETFWERVALHRSYAIGGHGDREFFFPVADFPRHLGPETAETCNTYNLLKLTRHLFAWRPDARCMDFYERGLYNHILASQDPALGTFVYLMSLEPGHLKTYSTPDNSFWCCVGTGMENHAKYADTIFAHDARGLFVNLFIPATVRWQERGVTLTQQTAFPEEEVTRLAIRSARPESFALRIRHPGWARGALTVTVNGQPAPDTSQPGSYLELQRTWQDGDRVEVRLPLSLHTEALPGASDTVAILYGPIVLAGELGIADMPTSYARDQRDLVNVPHLPSPAIVATGGDWLGRIELVSHSPLMFRTRDLARPQEVTLVPFHRVHHQRYTVYWPVRTPDLWKQGQDAAAATETAWAETLAKAVDSVKVGDANSEGVHGYAGDASTTGTLAGRSWRYALNHKGFGFSLKNGGATGPQTLVCALDGRNLTYKYSLVINGRKFPGTLPPPENPGLLYLHRLALPAELTAGRDSVSVRIEADDTWDASTGTFFGVALLAN
ncbi:MAG TPA: beta-L-arabinofuranosidase domain-containing protein [Lacunisphaera sp.]|nr:beta-L-arabinofuranosidase domain-containing protein [Lacunisphaera sp.]